MNEEKLKQKYTDIRIRMKKCKNGSLEKRAVKSELNKFIKEVEFSFGRDVVLALTKKKHG